MKKKVSVIINSWDKIYFIHINVCKNELKTHFYSILFFYYYFILSNIKEKFFFLIHELNFVHLKLRFGPLCDGVKNKSSEVDVKDFKFSVAFNEINILKVVAFDLDYKNTVAKCL